MRHNVRVHHNFEFVVAKVRLIADIDMKPQRVVLQVVSTLLDKVCARVRRVRPELRHVHQLATAFVNFVQVNLRIIKQ